MGFRRDETDVAISLVDLMIMPIMTRDMTVMTRYRAWRNCPLRTYSTHVVHSN